MSSEIEITHSGSPAEYSVTLEKLLARESAYPSPGEPPKKGIIRGRIIGNKVTLYSSTRANDFAPVFSGHILSSANGMVLRGRFHLSRPSRIALTLFRVCTVAVSAVVLALVLHGAYSTRTFDIKTACAIFMPFGFCVCMLLLISHLSRLRPKKLKDFIHQSFLPFNMRH